MLRKSPKVWIGRGKEIKTVPRVCWGTCHLTSHFNDNKTKLGQRKTTIWEDNLEKTKWKKWILHLNLKAVKSELISQAHITCKILHLCAALAKFLSPVLASLSFLTENCIDSFDCNSCQGRSWFLKRKASTFIWKALYVKIIFKLDPVFSRKTSAHSNAKGDVFRDLCVTEKMGWCIFKLLFFNTCLDSFPDIMSCNNSVWRLRMCGLLWQTLFLMF